MVRIFTRSPKYSHIQAYSELLVKFRPQKFTRSLPPCPGTPQSHRIKRSERHGFSGLYIGDIGEGPNSSCKTDGTVWSPHITYKGNCRSYELKTHNRLHSKLYSRPRSAAAGLSSRLPREQHTVIGPYKKSALPRYLERADI